MTTFLKAESPSLDHTLPASSKSSSSSSRSEMFGEQLRRARQKLNMTIEEIAERIKLDPRQVIALEEERFEDLPGTAFVRGFTKQYARVLKIDETPLLNLLPSLASSKPLNSTANHLGVMPRTKGLGARKRNHTIFMIAGGAAALGVLAFGATVLFKHNSISSLFSSNKTPDSNTPTESMNTQSVLPLPNGNAIVKTNPDVASETVTPVTTISSHNEPAPAAPLQNSTVALDSTIHSAVNKSSANVVAQPNGHISVKAPSSVPARIEFSFEERSWVEIKDSQGRVLLSQMNLPGSRQNVMGEPPYSVTVGNPHAVTVQYKGSTLDVLPYSDHDTARFTLD